MVVDDGSDDAVLAGAAVVVDVGAGAVVDVVVGTDVPVASAAACKRRSLARFKLLMAAVGSPFVSAV